MDEKKSQPQEEVLSQPGEAAAAKEKSGPSLQEQLNLEKDKYLRLLAEFENMRKRQERERQDIIKYAHEEVIIESLNIYEDLERSLAAFKAKAVDANLIKGLQMVYDNMRELMHQYQVKPIESVGKKFDPNAHEVLLQDNSGEHPDGHITEEFQKGYTLAGRVVRTAKVKVAKNINKAQE